MRVLLVASVVLVVLQLTFAAKDNCDKGEEYKTGQSSSCGEYKCGEEKGASRSCTKDSVSGCFCKKNHYRRSSDNKCVRKNQC
uniref:Putative tick til 8 n=1 Tax=Amblyomma triste TaxID=251400 RepID=A0A023G6M6_AMBTT